jgi:PAS domain S-box-containing protein
MITSEKSVLLATIFWKIQLKEIQLNNNQICHRRRRKSTSRANIVPVPCTLAEGRDPKTMPPSIISTLPTPSLGNTTLRRAEFVGVTLALSLLTAGVIWLALSFLVDEAAKTEMAVARVVAHRVEDTVHEAHFILAGVAQLLEANDDLREGARTAVEATAKFFAYEDAMAKFLAYDPIMTAISLHDVHGAAFAVWPVDGDSHELTAQEITQISFKERYGLGIPRYDPARNAYVWPIILRIDQFGDGQLVYGVVWINTAHLHTEISDVTDVSVRNLLFVRNDGVVMFRTPRGQVDYAEFDLSKHKVFSRIGAGEARGSFIGLSPIDGVRRIAGFAQEKKSGIIIVSSSREIEVLRDQLGHGAVLAVMLGSGLILVLAVCLGFALWQMKAEAARSERDGILGSLAMADASIAIADPRTLCLLYVNPAFERVTGYSAAEAIGKNCRFLQGPATDAATVAKVRESIAEGRPVRVDILNYRKDGSAFWSDLSIGPIRSSDGELRGFVGACFDISDRVRMADDLRSALVRARNADHAKSVFLARMSHELRTPLNAIIGFSEFMHLGTMGPLSERYAQYAGHIHDSGHHLLSLVERILEMARMEADGRVIETHPVDLLEIARSAVILSQSAIDSARAHISIDGLGPSIVQGEATALRQIVVNLVTNAARHGRKDGTIRVRVMPADSTCVQLEVTDDGPGIPPDLIERIGTPFLTGRADTADGQGVGLGIAISAELARRMGGRLEILNATPGVRATLTMPVVPTLSV